MSIFSLLSRCRRCTYLSAHSTHSHSTISKWYLFFSFSPSSSSSSFASPPSFNFYSFINWFNVYYSVFTYLSVRWINKCKWKSALMSETRDLQSDCSATLTSAQKTYSINMKSIYTTHRQRERTASEWKRMQGDRRKKEDCIAKKRIDGQNRRTKWTNIYYQYYFIGAACYWFSTFTSHAFVK